MQVENHREEVPFSHYAGRFAAEDRVVAGDLLMGPSAPPCEKVSENSLRGS